MNDSGSGTMSGAVASEVAASPSPRGAVWRGVSNRAAVFAREAALIGVAVGAVTEAVTSSKQLLDGEIGKRKYLARVFNRASVNGSATAARAVAAYALRETVKAVAKRAGANTLRRLASTGPATAIAFGGVSQLADTARLMTNRIDKVEYKQRSLQNVGTTGGGIGGAALGAAIGSVVPGPGTAVGAILGGIAGGMAGSVGGRRVGERLFKRDEVAEPTSADWETAEIPAVS